MGTKNSLEELLDRLLVIPLLQGDKGKESSRIFQKYRDEASKAPKIALVGLSGVGKSSTINALFNTRLHVSHTRIGTLAPEELLVKGTNVSGEKGEIVLYDMPGIGEDLESYNDHSRMYQEIIGQCDVAIWVINAGNRSMAYDQMLIRDVVQTANKDLTSRLVIGVNKVDIIHPGNWSAEANLPSVAQERFIEERLIYVREKLTKVIPTLTKDRIIAYSARRRYRLGELFHAMLKACAVERAWVLESRKDIADFWELVDPELRDEVLRRKKDSAKNK